MRRRESHEGGPYESDSAWVTRFYEHSLGAAGYPVEVADAIVRAASFAGEVLNAAV